MKMFDSPTRYMLFTGKGGVGKTSIACATAIALSDAGKRVLLVSTDPASNLDEVLQVDLGLRRTDVPNAAGLTALNVDPEAAAREYRERVVGPYRDLLPEAAVRNIEEQLSGACTVEIAAFDEFAKLLGEVESVKAYDHIIFDTAPTGHTLRLLQLPAAWTDFIQQNSTGTSCLGPLAGLQAQRDLYGSALQALQDSERTTVCLVSRPDTTALGEAERTRTELDALGIRNLRLVVNGVFRASDSNDAVAAALELRGQVALRELPGGLRAIPTEYVPLVARSLIGVEALRGFTSAIEPHKAEQRSNPVLDLPGSLNSLMGDLSRSGRGVVMTMGKGGVGKTTVAATVALELTALGHRVHLTTTDPAAHLTAAIGCDIPGLRITRIDPAAETKAYTQEVLRDAGKDLDDKGRALLEEDLRSPCTEEIAVFRAFARIVDEGSQGFVVIDTAPTGHTLLLLDAANAYHREVQRNLNHIPDSVSRLLPHLRDGEYTKILIVTLPEATPVHEAARLQQDLQRANIHPFAWVINQSFFAAGTTDPLLGLRGNLELAHIAEVQDKFAKRVALIPWQVQSPVEQALQSRVAVDAEEVRA